MGIPRAGHGLPMPWASHGMPAECPWAARGLPVGCPCIEQDVNARFKSTNVQTYLITLFDEFPIAHRATGIP